VQQDAAAAQEQKISPQDRCPSRTALVSAVRAHFVVQSHVVSITTMTCGPQLPRAVGDGDVLGHRGRCLWLCPRQRRAEELTQVAGGALTVHGGCSGRRLWQVLPVSPPAPATTSSRGWLCPEWVWADLQWLWHEDPLCGLSPHPPLGYLTLGSAGVAPSPAAPSGFVSQTSVFKILLSAGCQDRTHHRLPPSPPATSWWSSSCHRFAPSAP